MKPIAMLTAVAQTEAVKQRRRRRVHHAREETKTLSPFDSAPYDVLLGIGHCAAPRVILATSSGRGKAGRTASPS